MPFPRCAGRQRGMLGAHHLRRAWQGDGDRGWQTRAAQSLGISPQAITKLLADDDRRAEARRRAATRHS